MCLWNTNAPDNGQFLEGQDHKDKYFDTSRKILPQEMTMYNMEAFSILSLRVMTNVNFFLIGQMSRSKYKVPTKRSHHKGYSCKISDSSTHYSKVISKIKFKKKNRSHSKVKVTGQK